ncbi:MAG: dTDP-glucose 4,6-dehydratase [Puniceicoccaceae bacterium]
MRILVTGGCGFIGSNYLGMLLGRSSGEVEVAINLDCLSYAGNPANLETVADDSRYHFIEGSIGDRKTVAGILRDFEIEAVVNFAAESHVDRSIDSPEPFFENNVLATLRLLDECRLYWRESSNSSWRSNFRFLHVSTDEVFGSLGPNEPAFSETTPYAPNSPYAASKAASDFVVRSYLHTYGFPALTTNCSNNYGPYQFPEKLIPLMILNALEERDLPIYGDGMNVRDWLYVEDHCTAIDTVLQKGRIGESYAIGGSNERPNLEIVDLVCRMLDERKPRASGASYAELKKFVPDRPGHDKRYAIDSSKITSELGWKPKETFVSGMAKTVDWYLGNLNWCQAITSGRYQRERLGVAT